MLTKTEKRTLRKFRCRSTIKMSEDKFGEVAPSGLFYPVLKPGQYWWGGGGSVKVRLTDAGERALEEYRVATRRVFWGTIAGILASIAAITAIVQFIQQSAATH